MFSGEGTKGGDGEFGSCGRWRRGVIIRRRRGSFGFFLVRVGSEIGENGCDREEEERGGGGGGEEGSRGGG